METTEKQTEMFPEQARRRALTHDIPSAYAAAERALPTIGEKSKVFKDFAAYAKTLDVEHDRETVIGNLVVMRAKVGDLLGAIDLAHQQLMKAGELETEMREVEEKLGIPSEQRWDGRRGENRFAADDSFDDGYDDDEELPEDEAEDVQGGADDSVPHTLEDGTTGLEAEDGADDGEQIAEGAAQG